MTTKQKPHAAGYLINAGGAAYGTGVIINGERKANAKEAVARGHDANARGIHARYTEKHAAWLKNKNAGPDGLSTAEHAAKAKEYAAWTQRSSSTHPYVTPKLREEAHRRANDHRMKSMGSHAPEPHLPLEHGWAKTDAKWARDSAQMYRREGRIVGGVLIGASALSAGVLAHQRHKWEETKHRRNRGKFAPTGASTQGVKKSMDTTELFAKARGMHPEIVSTETVAKNLEAQLTASVIDEARELVAKSLLTDAGELAGKVGSKAKGVGTGAFDAAKPKVVGAGNALKNKFNAQTPGRKFLAVGAGGFAGGTAAGAMAQSRKPKQF